MQFELLPNFLEGGASFGRWRNLGLQLVCYRGILEALLISFGVSVTFLSVSCSLGTYTVIGEKFY